MKKIYFLIKGFYYDYKKDHEQAVLYYKKSNIVHSLLLYRIGLLLLKIKKYKEGGDFFLKSIQHGYDKSIVFYRLGICLEHQKMKKEASVYLKKALKLRPGYQPWVEHYLSCLLEENKGNITDEDFILFGKGKAEAWYEIAALRMKSYKYYQAKPALENAINLNDTNGKFWYYLGICNEKLLNFNDALICYYNAKKYGIRTEFLFFHLGLMQEKTGDVESSLANFSIACNIGKKDPKYGSAMLHKAEGNWVEMILPLKKFIFSHPNDDSTAYYNLALAYDFNCEWELAKENLEMAIYLDNYKNADWLCRLGVIYERCGLYDDACIAYKKALKIKNKDEFSYRLAACLCKNNNFYDACNLYSKKWNFNPTTNIDLLQHNLLLSYGNNSLLMQLGTALKKNGKFQEACNTFSHLLRMRYPNPYGVNSKILHENKQFYLRAFYLEQIETYDVEDNIIMYESFLGNTMSCNPYAIFKYIYHNPIYKNLIHIWVINDISNINNIYRKAKNIVFVTRQSESYLHYLAVSKYLINNVTFPDYFFRRKDQIYCNTWHGTPLKCLGKKNRYNPFGYTNVVRNFLQANFLIQPNDFTNKIMLDSHNIGNILPGKSIVTGYPRQDILSNITDEQKLQLKKEIINEIDKPILLYAPTWRDYESIEEQVDRCKSILAILNKSKYRVIFKGHQFIEKQLRTLDFPSIPTWIDTNELLTIVDVLVTDYSSIGIDFIKTGKPTIYIVPDKEAYELNRGLYINVEDFPGYLCYNLDELYNLINSELNANQGDAWKEKFNSYDDGYACQRVTDLLFNYAPEKKVRDKPLILFYAGTLIPNGISTAFIFLINSIINDFDIYIVVSSRILKDKSDSTILKKLHPNVHIIPHDYNMIMSVEENFYYKKWLKYNHSPSKNFKNKIFNIFKREYYRSFGETTFDAIVNFEGFNQEYTALLSGATEYNGNKIVYCHSRMFKEYSTRHPYLSTIFELYESYDKIVSVSIATSNLNQHEISSNFGIEINKFIHVDNVLDYNSVIKNSHEQINANDAFIFKGGPIFINIGRLSIEKDQSKLIRSFAHVIKEYPNAKLIIVGDGFLRMDLVVLINELKLQKNIFIIGYRENPYPYLLKSDCFVLSSNYEGQPMVILEAIALKRPIIVTDIASTRGMLKGTNAIITQNNEKDLARAIKIACKKIPAPVEMDLNDYNKRCIDKFCAAIGYHP